MKKVIFALAAVVALAACSKEQTVSFDKGAAIGFDTFVENSTRVGYSNDNMFADFAVYGVVTGDSDATAHIFDKEKVTKSGEGENATWTYTNTQYWINGAKYNFAAIAPHSNGAEGAFNGTSTSLTAFENTGENDLLYAQNAQYTQSVEKVPFTFKHVLSKVKFTFKNGYNATNTRIAVKNIHITNAHKTGNVVLGLDGSNNVTATWNNLVVDVTTPLDLNFGDAVAVIEQGESKASANEKLLIPSSNYDYNVTFDVELYYKKGENDWTLIKTFNHTVGSTLTFAPAFGNSYNVTAEITNANIDENGPQSRIEFKVERIEDWANGNTEDTNNDNVNDAYPFPLN